MSRLHFHNAKTTHNLTRDAATLCLFRAIMCMENDEIERMMNYAMSDGDAAYSVSNTGHPAQEFYDAHPDGVRIRFAHEDLGYCNGVVTGCCEMLDQLYVDMGDGNPSPIKFSQFDGVLGDQ